VTNVAGNVSCYWRKKSERKSTPVHRVSPVLRARGGRGERRQFTIFKNSDLILSASPSVVMP